MRKLSKVKGLLEFSLWRIKAQKEQLVLLFVCLVFFSFRNTEVLGFKLHFWKVIVHVETAGGAETGLTFVACT